MGPERAHGSVEAQSARDSCLGVKEVSRGHRSGARRSVDLVAMTRIGRLRPATVDSQSSQAVILAPLSRDTAADTAADAAADAGSAVGYPRRTMPAATDPESGTARRPFLEYPHGRLLAVLDGPREEEAARSAAASIAAATDIEILRGEAAADDIDATGARHGFLSRLVRVVQFTLMDQLPDLAWYEAALRDGRAVMSIRVGGLDEARAIAAALEPAGAHFVNHFGRFATAALVPWRGPEPAVPELMKR